jgi:peptidoglycan/LPS O-acetylase OafA/YrhL
MRSVLASAPIIRRRSDGIDALRGILALWVVFTHLIPWTVKIQGPIAIPAQFIQVRSELVRLFQSMGELHPAVVAFIVLSGYCIHRTGFRGSQGDFTRYAVRRSFRIMPVFLSATALGLFAASLGGEQYARLAGETSVDPACLTAKITGIAALVPYFHPCSYVGNAPLLTVMVEIWLYVAYAFIFAFLVWRGHERLLWALCAGAIALSLVVAIYASHWPVVYNWWQNSSLLAYLPFWWLGTLFLTPAVVRHVLPIGAMSLLVWLWLTTLSPSYGVSELKKLAFCGIVGAVIVWVDTERLPNLPLLSLIGKSGYSLYAIHAPLIALLLPLGIPWWGIMSVCLGTAGLSYITIERPLTQLGKTLSTGQVVQLPATVETST